MYEQALKMLQDASGIAIEETTHYLTVAKIRHKMKVELLDVPWSMIDNFIMGCEIALPADLTDAQIEALVDAWLKIVLRVIRAYRDLGFTFDSILKLKGFELKII